MLPAYVPGFGPSCSVPAWNAKWTEIRFHIERYTEDLVRGGVPLEEAKRRAQAEFGAIEARKDECRVALGLRFFDNLRDDLRYAFRILRKAPAFTTVAILSLSLGIGANTAIFSLMETALWKLLPVKSPEQLRLLSWVSGAKPIVGDIWGSFNRTGTGGRISTVFSYAVFQELQGHNGVLESLFAFKPSGRLTAVIDSRAELVASEMVSGNFYESVGVSTIAGRPITPADDTKRSEEVVTVISDGFWARRFGRQGSVIGKRIELNQIPVTIIGVNPRDFRGMYPGENPDVFVPVSKQPVILPNQWAKNGTLLDDPDYWWLLIAGRLRDGVSELQAQAALDVNLQQAVHASLPGKKGDLPRLRLATGARGLDELRDEFSQPLLVLTAPGRFCFAHRMRESGESAASPRYRSRA